VDLDHILRWMTGLSCALLALRLGRRPDLRRTGWFALSVGLGVALLALHVWRPGEAGLIVGPAWALLIMAPLLLSSAMQRCILRGHLGAALWISRAVMLLHPMDGMRRYPRLLSGLALLDQGQTERARQRLQGLQDSGNDRLSRSARVLLARAEGDWQSLLDWVGGLPGSPLLADSAVLAGSVRALGETDQPAQMLALYRARADAAGAGRDGTDHAITTLIMAALLGRLQLVKALLSGPAGALPATARDLWHATALQRAGRHDDAAAVLERTREACSVQLAREYDRRLSQPLSALPPEALDDEARTYLDELLRRVQHEGRFAPLSGGGGLPRATLGLAALLIGVFALQLPGGATDYENLMSLGALLVPVELTPGEWWRRLSAGFLHFGWMHLGMNLAGLLLLGTWLERAWNAQKLVATFLLCTLASLWLYPLVSGATLEQPQVLVGASGGVMGLLGALLGWLIVGRTQGRSAAVSNQLRSMLLLVGVQVVFDWNTPMVSGTAHLLGLSCGLALGLALGGRAVRRSARAG